MYLNSIIYNINKLDTEEWMAGFLGSISILDIVVVTLTILLLLFGIWRGMYKIIYGLISSIIALTLAIILTTTVVNFTIDNTLLDDKLIEVISKPLDNHVPNSKQVIQYYDFDSDPNTPDELGFDPGTGAKPFSDLLKGSKLSFLSSPLKSIVAKQVDKDGPTTFLNAVVSYVMAYILIGIAFIILWILLFIFMKIIFLIIKKAVTTTYLGYYINKILGGVLGLVIGAVLVFGFLTIVKLMGNYPVILSVNQMISESTVAKFLAENNFVYNFIADQIDVQSVIDKIMAMISRAGI